MDLCEQNLAIYVRARIETRNAFKLYGLIRTYVYSKIKISSYMYLGYVLLLLRPSFLPVIHPYSQIGISSIERRKHIWKIRCCRSSILTSVLLPYCGWWSGWRRFSMLVLYSTLWSIATNCNVPRLLPRTAVTAGPRFKHGVPRRHRG